MEITDNSIVRQTPKSSIVVVAASAGGLTAIDELLCALRDDNNASYFVLQQLANDSESALVSRLRAHTRMPVIGMSDGILTQPNVVYVLPPAHIARLVENKLLVSEAPDAAFAHPVDVFCTSIAEQTEALASAVFLSGVGDDGCAGAVALKSAGHEVLVQLPETARFPNLPARILNACTTVDFVLAPDGLANQLNQHKDSNTSRVQHCANEALPEYGNAARPMANEQQVLRGMNAELHERIAFLESKVNHLQAMHAAQEDTFTQNRLTPLNVLVVDDDSNDRALMRALLGEVAGEQYQVSEAASAGEAMSLLTEEQFDLCLLEYRLDDITASGLLDALPENRYDTAFVVVSDLLDLVIEDHSLTTNAVPALDKKRLTPDILRKSIKDVMQSDQTGQTQVGA
ncbi:MAG: chemotaxis protein CheB [Pseudomonadota bacterium]